MQKLKLISDIPPSVNHYLSYRAVIKNGKPLAMSYKTAESVKYQKKFTEYVQKEAIKQDWVKSDNVYQHYYMDVVFYFPRIDMDANNYFKIMVDSITSAGNVWIDDTQLCERVQAIYYSSDNPRVELEIYPVEYIGVFKNTAQLEKFKKNCVGCTRYSRNCRILERSQQGRIQAEVENNKCSKFLNSKTTERKEEKKCQTN